MEKLEYLKSELSQLIERKKLDDGGFKYVCKHCEFECLGRKGISNHLEEQHLNKLKEINKSFETDKDFQSQISKLVMTVPFCAKDSSRAVYEVRKDYPITLDFMKIIDSRTTRIPRYGSLIGRIARLLAMIIAKEEVNGSKPEEIEERLKCIKCKVIIGKTSDLFPHLEKSHQEFLTNLDIMFPPAIKRMHLFIQQAANKFNLTVPTGKEVEELQIMGEKTKEKYSTSEMFENVIKLTSNGEGLQANTIVNSELFGSKHEIRPIETDSVTEAKRKRKSRLEQRMKTYLDKLTPSQLRKIFIAYFDYIDNISLIPWSKVCQSTNMENEFLIGFLETLYKLAKLNGETSFNVGNIIVTSKQSKAIVDTGFRSHRDFVKKESWEIPTSWEIDNPSNDLGSDWTRTDDCKLLIGSSKFGKNLKKIIAWEPDLKSKACDNSGVILDSFKKRFGYLLNIYQNRGVFVKDLGFSFYSEDINEDESIEENTEEEYEIEEGEIL